MMLTLMLTSKGVAGVPRAALVILAATVATFNLPLAGVALVLGVDALMDKAAAEVDLSERKKQYVEFQQILAEEQALVYLTHMQYTTAQHKYVRGVPKGPWGSLNPWDEMYFDKK